MSYPLTPESFTPRQDGPGNTIAAAHINALQTALEAITQALLTTGLAHALLPDATANVRALGSASQRFGQAYLKGLTLGASTELTIASGVITATPGVFSVDTEADAASDDLDTITAGTGVAEGSIVILRAENVARVVTLKDGTGNMLLNGDYGLSATDRTITLLYDGTNWREIARSGNLVVEGTWTPTIVGTGGQSGQVYASQVGSYIKVGKLVFVHGRLVLSTLGTVTTAAAIGGLPFASENTANQKSTAHIGYWANMGSTPSYVSGVIEPNSSQILLYQITSGASMAATVQGSLSNTTELVFSACYRAGA